MKGEMRCNKSEVMKEGLACVIFLMVCQAFNRMVGGGGGGGAGFPFDMIIYLP